MLKKPPTHKVDSDFKNEKITLNGINPADLKLVLDGEAAKKGVTRAKIYFVDCQSLRRGSSHRT